MGLQPRTSVDGEITATADARIPPADDGLLRGDGAFEVIRLYDGRPFALGDHLDRLERSAGAIELGFDRGALEAEIDALLKENGDADGQLRTIVTRGGRRLLFTEELPPRPETIALASVAYTPTIILTGVKSLSYAANMQATRLAKARGGGEALLVRPDGIVMEAPTSTLFWVTRDGALRTPAIGTGILASITRDRLLGLADVEEGEWTLDEVQAASEAFLASTTREVHPVSSVDDAALPAAPGPVTADLAERFTALVRSELEG